MIQNNISEKFKLSRECLKILEFILLVGLWGTHNIISAQQQVIYVNINSSVSGDGSSWNEPLHNIQEAIEVANSVRNEIWVAQGIYYENIIAFKPIKLFGGFSGDEKFRSERDVRNNRTIIDGNGSGRCILITAETTIDGFIIQNGKILDDGTLYEARGGGILADHTKVTIRNNIFRFNHAGWGGGAYINDSEALIEYNIFAHNEGTVCAGGLELDYSAGVVRQNTIVDNFGFGLEIPTHLPNILGSLYNNIVAGNAYNNHPRFTTPPYSTDVWALARNCTEYSFVGKIWAKGEYWDGPDGKNNIYGDISGLEPGFVDKKGMDYHLLPTSPCIGSGKPDENGNPTDMGAFPYQLFPRLAYISGRLYFYGNPEKGISTSVLLKSKDSLVSTSSDSLGYFNFANLRSGESFIIRPNSGLAPNAKKATTFYDAALTSRFAIGLEALTETQQIAADVDNNGQILFYDAALIARFAIGLPLPTNSSVGYWRFSPDSSFIQTLNENIDNLSFSAVLLGDVDFSWGKTNPTAYSKHLMKQVGLDLFHPKKLMQDDKVIFQIDIGRNESPIYSFDLELVLPRGITFSKYQLEEEKKEAFILVKKKENKIRIGGFRSHPFDEEDQLKAFFQIMGSQKPKNIHVSRFLINGQRIDIKNQQDIYDYRNSTISNSKYEIQNYPNPFNDDTVIWFEIPYPGHSRIEIFNAIGQKIITLQNTNIQTGSYSLRWNGRDSRGQKIPSGLYWLRWRFNERTIDLIKILYLQ